MVDTRRTRRWDRLLLRILVCLAIGVSVLPPWWSARLGDGPARSAGGAAVVVVLWATVLAWGGTTPTRPVRIRPWMWAMAMALCCALLPVLIPGMGASWILFLGAAAAALSGWELPWSLLIAVPPALSLGMSSWRQGHDLADLTINVTALVAVTALAIMRVRQREAAELAAAQRRVIDWERSRAQSRARREETAARLHDVLAHTLSGLIVTTQSIGLEMREEHADQSLIDRVDMATALARDGLEEARRAVESLHEDPAQEAPVDLASWLETALDRLRDGAGLCVTVAGSPGAVDPSWSDLTRSVVMEALTNSVRHAAGLPVSISFLGPPEAAVTVLSAGDPSSFVDRGHAGGGRGLSGLAARVDRRGGSLSFGPVPRGYEVRLVPARPEPSA